MKISLFCKFCILTIILLSSFASITKSSYSLDKKFYAALINNKINPEEVLELKILPLSIKDEIQCWLPRAIDSLQILSKLKNLKSLHFEKLNISSSVDTIITFDPETFDEIIEVIVNRGEYSAYSILPFLDYFKNLEELKLNFIDNEQIANQFKTDFDWFRITHKVEGDLNQQYYNCFIENKNKPPFHIYDFAKITEMSWLWHWEEIYPTNYEIDENKYQRIEELPWEPLLMSDEEYCRTYPSFCNENDKPYFDREVNEDESIDTAFLKEIGAWPPTETKETITERDRIIEEYWNQTLDRSKWLKYGTKCSQLLKMTELKLSQTQLGAFLYSQLSDASKKIIDIKSESPNEFNSKLHLLRELYANELWESLSKWDAIPRNKLLLDQLQKLKNLKTLSISNNYHLNLKDLFNVISQELTNLEVLEISNCQVFSIPENIHKLGYLQKIIIDNKTIDPFSSNFRDKEKQ